MASLKSKLVALYLRYTRKKAFMSAQGLHEWIAKARKTQTHLPPQRLSSQVEVKSETLEGHTVYEVLPRDLAGQPLLDICYLHGGAYCFEITSFHWDLIAELSQQLRARIMVPIYPLAPEYRFDDIFGFAKAAYRLMVERSDPERMVFAGDSAGANMAVVLTMMGAQEKLTLPACHVLVSPGLDMTMAEAEMQELAAKDPWLDIPGGLEAINLYAPEMDRADWRISPVNGDLSVLPPTLILAGTRDLLTPSTIAFAEKAKAAGVDVELEIARDMIHVWPLIDMPEARIARDRIIAYLNGRFSHLVAPNAQRAAE